MMQIRETLAERRQARLESLESEIFSARMHVKAEMLYVYALLSALLSGTATFLLLAYLSQLIIPLSFFLVFPVLGVVIVLVWLAIALAAMYGAFTAILYLPTIECGSRKLRIDLSMFNSATYLYALHQSEPNLYAVVESLAKYADYYGEAARELRQIVYDCRMCSMDFYSAVWRLSETTPSDKFRFFLTGLSSSYKTIGSATDYLRMKVEELREEQRISQKVYLNTLGVIAEMYITIFVAGPLFIIIVVMVMGMISSANPLILALIIYVMLPFGTAVFLLMLDMISEVHEDKSEEIHEKKGSIWEKKPEFSSVPMMMPKTSESPAFERLRKRDEKEKYVRFLASPVEYMKFHPSAVFVFSVPAAFVVMGILYFLFVTVSLTPWTFLAWVGASEDIVMTGVLIVLIPFAVFYAIYSRRHRRIEEAIPDFADRMASAVRHNMTLARAIDLIAMEGKSNMLDEIRLIRRDIVWGSLTSDAIKRFSEYIRVGAIDRMSILVSQAEHFTNNLSQVLQIIAEDSKNMVTLKSERRGDMMLYVIVVYLAFFVFVFVQGILVVMFLPMMLQGGDGMSMIGSGVTMPGVGGGFSIDVYDRLIYHSVVIHGFCSGLVAGMMGEGSALAGVKHSCVMVAVAMIVFVILKFFFLS
ncbi:type II secretion system F family protein [Methanocorpusculum sp. MG]|uniref:Type II secretion system F family protein n=1 Tax=Methanocorpusculum petauri TaxID=3002863 RepID=A0ABT4IHH6_9EURY|nr:type II secretion system F family protein [Methanocorpusculum petauri]MCZ0860610.1 type II secretion system F family protein [Methanocorpusculum petauri]